MPFKAMHKFFGPGSVGIDNKSFQGKVVPFAPQSEGEKIALKKFARAHRAWYVWGPPAYLLTVKIPAKFALQHFLDQDIIVVEKRPEPKNKDKDKNKERSRTTFPLSN